MELADFLGPDDVIVRLRATNKKQVLQYISRHASKTTGCSEREIFYVLMERERLGTTGFGNGIANPHGKLPGLGRLYGLFARLDHPIDFDAIDDRPCDLIFLLLAPECSGADYLKALARLSRLLRDKVVCAKIRDMADAKDLYALLTDTQPVRLPNRPDNPLA
jgi:PTS system nitrogen regulatory IIA component